MRSAEVRADGTTIRWVELPGVSPARVYLHGLGASSAPYYAAVANHPALGGHRSLLVDLLGHGISDRPADATYSLEEHADLLAAALGAAEVTTADVVAHSMGGAVAILLAARHPQLVARLVLLEANLDPSPPGVGLGARYTEEDFVRGPGWEETLRRVGPRWAATMRLTDRLALYRTAVHLGYGSVPTMREVLLNLAIPRTYLHSGDHEPAGVNGLVAAGVRVLAVPDSGHNIMLDNPDAFVQATAEALSAQPATSTPT